MTDEDHISNEIQLPDIDPRGFPKAGEVPYIDDFDNTWDDSGLERFLDDQIDLCGRSND